MSDPTMGRSRPSPDAVLALLGVLVAASSFLPWQRGCCGSSWNAWTGNGELAGGVMAGLSVALVVLTAMAVTGRSLPAPIPHDYVVFAVGTGSALFAVVKFVLVAGRHPTFGAWAGLGLGAAVGMATAWRVRERRVGSVRP